MRAATIAALVLSVMASAAEAQPAPPSQPAPPAKGIFVDLAYPVEALEARVTGAVVVRATIDASGRVVEAEALSGPEALRPASVANLKQWTFVPGGEPIRLVVYRFEIEQGACNDDRRSLFRLHGNLAVITACTGVGRPLGYVWPTPQLPIVDWGKGTYPQIAQSARVGGILVLDVSVDRHGRVTDVRALNSIPLLNDAALAHVRTFRIDTHRPRRGIIVYEYAECGDSCTADVATFRVVTGDFVRMTAAPNYIQPSSSQSTRR